MAAGGKGKSSFLNNDSKIYDLSETINAPCYFKMLGMDMLESEAEVSSIIGKTSIDYGDVVFRCLIMWRNDRGVGDGQCRELIMILKECGLTDVASWLQQKQEETPTCLSKDGVLHDMSTKINGPEYYKKLGLKLVESEVTLANMVGNNAPPCYRDALFRCFIQFRNKEGSTLETSIKLRRILRKRKLNFTVDMLEKLEPEICNTDENVNDMCSGDSESMHTTEPEAGLLCKDRITPEGSSEHEGASVNQ